MNRRQLYKWAYTLFYGIGGAILLWAGLSMVLDKDNYFFQPNDLKNIGLVLTGLGLISVVQAYLKETISWLLLLTPSITLVTLVPKNNIWQSVKEWNSSFYIPLLLFAFLFFFSPAVWKKIQNQ